MPTNGILTQTGADLFGKTVLTKQDTGQELSGDLEVTGSITGGDVTIGHLTRRTVILTNAQIKALPTTPIELIPAPGAGFRIVPVIVNVQGDTLGAAYTNIDPDSYLSINYGTGFRWSNYISNDSTVTETQLDDTFGSAGKFFFQFSPGQKVFDPAMFGNDMSASFAGDALEDDNLELTWDNSGSGVLTGGNAANGLKITLYYMIEEV